MQLKVDVLVSQLHPQSGCQGGYQDNSYCDHDNSDPVQPGLYSLARPEEISQGLPAYPKLTVNDWNCLKRWSRQYREWESSCSRDATTAGTTLKEYETAARALKIPLQSLAVRGPNPDLGGCISSGVEGPHASAVIAVTNRPLLLPYMKKVADLAIKNRLPSMYEASQYVDAGGLVSYSADEAESFRRAAYIRR